MNTKNSKAVKPDWISKTLAGLLLGFTLAIGCSGLFSWLIAEIPLSIRGQLTMWIIAPVWVGILCSVYFFSSGKHAWFWLMGANSLVFATLLFFYVP